MTYSYDFAPGRLAMSFWSLNVPLWLESPVSGHVREPFSVQSGPPACQAWHVDLALDGPSTAFFGGLVV